MSLQNRYEFVLLFDVQDGNPNGDPNGSANRNADGTGDRIIEACSGDSQ